MDYIAHHGIKGMKWGVRRYQNPDGSLTSEGRIRYGLKTVGRVGKELSGVPKYYIKRSVTKMNQKADKNVLKKQFGTVSQRMCSNREKAKLINRVVSDSKSGVGKTSGVYNILRSSVGDMARHFGINARDLQTAFDISYEGPDEPRLIGNDYRDFKKIFPGITDRSAGIVQQYAFDAFVDRVNSMQIDKFSVKQKNGSRSDEYIISERRSGNTGRLSLVYTSGHSNYIDASKNGCKASVELTSNRKFTVNSLDTLGFTNAEIAQKTGLSIGQVNNILYGYELD